MGFSIIVRTDDDPLISMRKALKFIHHFEFVKFVVFLVEAITTKVGIYYLCAKHIRRFSKTFLKVELFQQQSSSLCR